MVRTTYLVNIYSPMESYPLSMILSEWNEQHSFLMLFDMTF